MFCCTIISPLAPFSPSDINECNTSRHNCDQNANCQNTAGSYTCSCLAGYAGSGLNGNCSGKRELILQKGWYDNPSGVFFCSNFKINLLIFVALSLVFRWGEKFDLWSVHKNLTEACWFEACWFEACWFEACWFEACWFEARWFETCWNVLVFRLQSESACFEHSSVHWDRQGMLCLVP